MFGRIFLNPTSKKDKWEVNNAGDIDWNSAKSFQILENEEIEIELENVNTSNTIIVQVYETKETPGGGVRIEELGFSVLPVLDGSLNPIVGIHILPIYEAVLDALKLREFAKQDAWELLDSID